MPKEEFIKTMFNEISPKYDILNDVLSFGTHRLWKSKLAKRATVFSKSKILDCATGTGDVAFLMEKNGASQITGIDFSSNMIDLAKKRGFKNQSLVRFEVSDLSKLKYENDTFDAATVSFGIRNVESLPLALKELSRVSKSLYILEFGKPKNRIYSYLYFFGLKFYFPIFSFISGRSDAYEYLISSSKTFPSGDDFCVILSKNTDYKRFKTTPVFGGIAYLYECTK
jgi:demethylmenaquinone methyltransferase/2-methoxy-6-polyprenyl-1,4-benzoquinol methylase